MGRIAVASPFFVPGKVGTLSSLPSIQATGSLFFLGDGLGVLGTTLNRGEAQLIDEALDLFFNRHNKKLGYLNPVLADAQRNVNEQYNKKKLSVAAQSSSTQVRPPNPRDSPGYFLEKPCSDWSARSNGTWSYQ